jgi:NAD(P)-dependent dehydrogenase (short-subunit alcohol dehydrogenase family)
MKQRVMITAGGSGIGWAIAKAFADDDAQVHVCDIDEKALGAATEEYPQIAATHLDVSSEASVNAWFNDALEDMGGLDVFINNAGIKGPTAFVENIDYADWRQCIDVCLNAQFLCVKRAVPPMKEQKSGVIINISSTAGLFGFGMRTPYAAAKWAVIGLTKSLAIELGPHNVRCNAICPGAVRGERINRVIRAEAEHRGSSFAEVEKEMVKSQSISRFVEPTEIADMCLFLASPAAKMVTGQAIAVDGHHESFHIR